MEEIGYLKRHLETMLEIAPLSSSTKALAVAGFTEFVLT